MNVNISLPKFYHDYLTAEKKRTGKTLSEIIRRGIDLYRVEATAAQRGEKS